MAAINYAVLVVWSEGGPQVEHLYQHRADAEACAGAYTGQLGLEAFTATLSPPLSIARRGDLWAALARESPVLRLHPSPEVAAADEGRPVGLPIRRNMPVQRGVPQFAPALPRNTPAGGRLA